MTFQGKGHQKIFSESTGMGLYFTTMICIVAGLFFLSIIPSGFGFWYITIPLIIGSIFLSLKCIDPVCSFYFDRTDIK
jgi:hypothetical protein